MKPTGITLLPTDPTATLNDVTRRYPHTITAFRNLGIDSCSGGALTLTRAAAKAGVGLDELQPALRDAVSEPALTR